MKRPMTIVPVLFSLCSPPIPSQAQLSPAGEWAGGYEINGNSMPVKARSESAGGRLGATLDLPQRREPAHPGQQLPPGGHWTGGFWLDGNWAAVNLRLPRPDEAAGATADVLFPAYGGGENAVNVAVDRLERTPDRLHFEVPVRTTRVVFDGQHKDGTISGEFDYDKAKGTFGLTRWAYVPVDALEKYYGAYRVAPDRVISVLRGWGHPRTLNYVDYKTGQV